MYVCVLMTIDNYRQVMITGYWLLNVGLYAVTSTVKHIYNFYSCLRVLQCSVYKSWFNFKILAWSRSAAADNWNGMRSASARWGLSQMAAPCRRGEMPGRLVITDLCWLSASAQCVARCRAPAGGGAWQADGSLATLIHDWRLAANTGPLVRVVMW